MKRLTFKEFYAERFHRAQDDDPHWAGAPLEQAHIVHQRLADAMAAYMDYLQEGK